MASYEPDRDYGDENAYEDYRARLASSGMCEGFCNGENEALPDEDFCSDCLAELQEDTAA